MSRTGCLSWPAQCSGLTLGQGLVILLVIIVKTVFRAAKRMFTLPAVTNKESALLAREMLMCADANSVIQRCVSHLVYK